MSVFEEGNKDSIVQSENDHLTQKSGNFYHVRHNNQTDLLLKINSKVKTPTLTSSRAKRKDGDFSFEPDPEDPIDYTLESTEFYEPPL